MTDPMSPPPAPTPSDDPPGTGHPPALIRLALVDDSKGFAESMQQAFAACEGIAVVAVCSTAGEALAQLPARRPDVVLLDMQLPDLHGTEVLARLVPTMPETDFVVLTVFDDDDTISTAIRNGASGYLLKRSGSEDIANAVRTVRSGGSPLDAAVSRRLLSLMRKDVTAEEGLPELSLQENRLLRQISHGQSVKEASDTIGVTYATGRTYLRHIYAKLGVQSQVQAVRRFFNLQAPSQRKGLAGMGSPRV